MDIKQIQSIDTLTNEYHKKQEAIQEIQEARQADKKDKSELSKNKEASDIEMATLRYGYNSATADLVVKITNADGSVGQYPTDSMMKLKQLLKEEFIKN